MDSQNLLPRTPVREQWAKNHGKDGRIAGRYLTSKSVVPSGQRGMETKAASDTNCPDEHSIMASAALLKVLLPNLPQASCRRVNQRKAFQSCNKYLHVECLPCARDCSRC